MKVLIATGLYPPEIGGPATYAKMLENELPSRHIAGVVVPFGWLRHYPKFFRHSVYAWKLWKESKNVDIFYALDPVSVGFATQLIAKLRSKPFMIRLGGDYAWEQGRIRFGVDDTLDNYLRSENNQPLVVRIMASVQSYVTRQAVSVVSPSEYLKTVITKWGVNEDKIKVIYSSLFPLVVNGNRDEIRRQLEYTNPTIVTAGRLVPWKGFLNVIKAIEILKDKFPEISLIIVGDGEERKKLESYINKNNLQGNIRLTGRVSKNALGATIKGADVFILNTAYEGLSHQLLEVMDLGVPIVTTNVCGNPELITNGIEGLLIKFDDTDAIVEAVTKLLNNQDISQRLVQSARVRVKDFEKERAIDRIVELLQNIYDTSA